MARKFSTIQAAVDAIARGEVIIVVDAEDRENEGDFICAAEKATPENVNLVMSGRGDFCMPVLPDICRRATNGSATEAVSAFEPVTRRQLVPRAKHRSRKGDCPGVIHRT